MTNQPLLAWKLVAGRLAKPKNEIVREASRGYADRIGKLSEKERVRMLRIFDEMLPKVPERPVEEVEAELAEIRRARRGGGRRTSVDRSVVLVDTSVL